MISVFGFGFVPFSFSPRFRNTLVFLTASEVCWCIEKGKGDIVDTIVASDTFDGRGRGGDGL